jgi:Flp pilus assembly protein TadD
MRRGHSIFIGLFLTVATLVVFWQVLDHDFVGFDDDKYVTENHYVQAGLTKEGLIWAFTTAHVSNWHPLTWLSHMVDCQLHGLNPAGHHLANLLFHVLNTLLLYLVFRRLTGSIWRSGFVAALFALHPLHVESVAWVAERKDVLSTFFWMFTIWAYARYVEIPGFWRYLLTLFTFALGLMAKPMLVTLPFVLLLLDYWPLERFRVEQTGGNTTATSRALKTQRSSFPLLLWEKTPFFALTAVSGVVTLFAQKSGGALGAMDIYPVKIRIANTLVSYVSYIGKMIWPQNLAVFYPHPGQSLTVWQAALAGLLLVVVSVVVIGARRRYPYLLVGWLWYVGTLVPVIGLVQVGMQAMADRYTYVPLIGLFIIIAWGVPDLLAKWRYRRAIITTSVGILISAMTICTWLQVRHWKSSITLFEHALQVTPKNHVAHNNLGNALEQQDRVDEAIRHLSEALELKPDFAGAHNNLGNALAKQGNFNEAVAHFSKAIQLKPDFAGAHLNLGNALEHQDRVDEAIFHFARALQHKPDFAEAYYNMGNALARQGKLNEAVSHFSKALQFKPYFAEAHNNLGTILARQGELNEAIFHFSEALRLKPDYLQARANLDLTLQMVGKTLDPPSSSSTPLK